MFYSRSFQTLFFILSLSSFPATSVANDIRHSDINMDVHVEAEDREVGLKRLELIDKMLSKDLIDRKRALVKDVEADYNKKISKLIQGMMQPVTKHTVITHIDVNFFATDFESEIQASQKVSVSVLLKKGGFADWREQFASDKEALDAIKQVISSSFAIKPEKISILLI